MRPHVSITTRVTAIFALLSTVVMIAIGWIASYSVEEHFAEEDLAEINGKLELIQHAFNKVTTPADLVKLPQELTDALIGHHALSILVYKPDGRKLYTSTHAKFPEKLLKNDPAHYGQDRAVLTKWKHDSQFYRGLTVQMKTGLHEAPHLNVAIAVDTAHHEDFISRFQRSLWMYLAICILAMTIVGWIAARRGLTPIRDFVRVASRISASRLNERMQVETLPREVVDLGISFNDMLNRLQDSFIRLSDFSSDIAHELRTPVSNLMTQNQVALSQARSTEEYQEILYSNIEEYERLSRMIADMLFLAKADNGLIVPHREEMDLGKEIDAVIEFYEPVTTEKGITIQRSGNAVFNGDALMMRRAFSNLISNAIRYTPEGQVVKVTLASGTDPIRIGFQNPGPHIPSQILERVFDRFYRIDSSRQRDTEGTGLGLAITKSIIEAHGGKIRALSTETTVCIEITL